MNNNITESVQNNIYTRATEIIEKSRSNIINQIYKESTITYFKLGELIVEGEQKGEDTPEYGKGTIKNLSHRLTIKYGKGYSVTTLKDARQFYNTYKNRQAVSGDLKFSLGFTHYIILTRVHDNERDFYEQLAIKEAMSSRVLQKSISSNTALRLLKNKEDINNIVFNPFPDSPKEILKDPIVAGFLGIDQVKEGEESKIEEAIINNLEAFLLELGRGFAYVGRQYGVIVSGKQYRADLVFYNIYLKRYVIFELKAREAQHKDIGQLQMYVNYFDRDICIETDNETIGVLLCKEKDQDMINYTLPLDNKNIYASELMLYLPTRDELMKLIETKK
jgi:predicted nuclease of restriction endonuclease-like (RecB) superfamily